MKLMIGCNEATLMMLKDEEQKLSLSGKLQLVLHLHLCKYCNLFKKQSKFISNTAKHLTSDKNFTPAEKQKLINLLKSSIN